MSEYIERETAIAWFMPYAHAEESIDADVVISDIKGMKAADVAPVRHGRWIDGHCSECGAEATFTTWTEPVYDYDWEENLYYSHDEIHNEYNETNYCPNCGAKLDGDKDA